MFRQSLGGILTGDYFVLVWLWQLSTKCPRRINNLEFICDF